MTVSTIDRNLLRAPGLTGSMSSPKLSVKREMTPPAVPDPALLLIHDRLNQLDSKVLDLRTTVLTKDTYVDRRNREDEFIRREFEGQRQQTGRIDSHVGRVKVDITQLKTDLNQLKTEIIQLRTQVVQLSSKEALLHTDVNQLQSDVSQLQNDVHQLHADVCGTRTDLSQVQVIVSQLRIELLTLQRDTSQQFGKVFNRFSVMESRMKHMDRIRFNSLAHTIHAPITPVPVVDEEDGSVRFPEYFPRTVWKFWCLKKKTRLERLVYLADFYELEGYQYWGRMPHPIDSMHPGDEDSDSSESSDHPSDLTRAEAVQQYPEACHQALAATLGLVYYKIRNEVGEGRPPHFVSSGHKRVQDDVSSINSAGRSRPEKRSRRNDISPPTLYRLINPPSIDSKSMVSEHLDKLGWNVHLSQMSDETMSKIKGIVSEEVSARLLRAIEHGVLKLKDSRFDRSRVSPTESAKLSIRRRPNVDGIAIEDEDMPTAPETIATELLSPCSARDESPCMPEGMSDDGSSSPQQIR